MCAKKNKRLADPDLRESLIVSSLICLLLLGLPYVLSWLWVVAAGLRPRRHIADGPVLVCGHRLENGDVSAQYRARLDEAARLVRHSGQPVLLLGGGHPSEAAAGRDYLVAAHGMSAQRIVLEEESTDSLENLRNAKRLLSRCSKTRSIVLVSSRYHLARLGAFARQLGLTCHLHPAKPRRRLGAGDLSASFKEAALLSFFYLGRFYARLARRRHLLARIE